MASVINTCQCVVKQMDADPVSAQQKSGGTHKTENDTQLCGSPDGFLHQVILFPAIRFCDGRKQHNRQGIT